MLLRLEGIACGRSRFSDEDEARRLTGFLFPVDRIYRLIMYAGRRWFRPCIEQQAVHHKYGIDL